TGGDQQRKKIDEPQPPLTHGILRLIGISGGRSDPTFDSVFINESRHGHNREESVTGRVSGRSRIGLRSFRVPPENSHKITMRTRIWQRNERLHKDPPALALVKV